MPNKYWLSISGYVLSFLRLPNITMYSTSTHGAMGAVAFGIGTSEVEMVMASQCILQTRPKTMRITVDGNLGKGVTAKDVALYMMSKMTTSGATGYFGEYAGEAVRSLSMEGRLTLCNLSIEMGAQMCIRDRRGPAQAEEHVV